jgi:hypothetical protein
MFRSFFGWSFVCSAAIFHLMACGPANTGPDYDGSCPSSGCSLPGVALRFEVTEQNAGFFGRPWPADARLSPDGHLDLHDFPNPGPSSLLQETVRQTETETRGYGTNAAVYFSFTAAIDTTTLPSSPNETFVEPSPVFLVNLSEGPGQGERIPLIVRFLGTEKQFTPANTLVLRPVPGFPLRASNTYAAVVTRAVFGQDHLPLGATSDFEQTKYKTSPKTDSLRTWWEHFQPAYRELEKSGLPRREIAALTVFTTQPIPEEMDRVEAFLAQRPAPTITDWRQLSPTSDFYLFEGWFDMPEFQAGEPPDFEGGGGFVFDSSGNPVVQRTTRIPFALSIPKAQTPSGGFPIVMQAHGTGGDRFSHFQGTQSPAAILARRGIASIGLDQPLHGSRNPWGRDPSLTTFNVFNMVAMRDNFRQGGSDLFVLRRLIEDFHVPEGISPTGSEIPVDGNRVAFLGHSQGGITGPIFLGSDKKTTGAVLSGSGGGMGVALLEKKQPTDIRALLVLGFLLKDEELDLDHPVIQLFQTAGERSDPMNYARRFALEPKPSADSKHLLFTEGLQDVYTMPGQIEALASASGCALMNPVSSPIEAMELRGVTPVDPPVTGNLQAGGRPPVTAVLIQYPEDGHFAIFENSNAMRHYADFLESLLKTGSATVGP